jgi:hypothetical protein
MPDSDPEAKRPHVPDDTDPQNDGATRRDALWAGLCAHCRHVRRTPSDRGSVFYRCDFARVDPAYPKYPALPVLRCAAFTAAR